MLCSPHTPWWGAFGNDESWIDAAMRRALEMMSGFDLDVRLVSYGAPSQALLQIAQDFSGKNRRPYKPSQWRDL